MIQGTHLRSQGNDKSCDVSHPVLIRMPSKKNKKSYKKIKKKLGTAFASLTRQCNNQSLVHHLHVVGYSSKLNKSVNEFYVD